MTLDDFRRLIARISLAAPLRTKVALAPVPRAAPRRPVPLRPVRRTVRPA